MLEKLNEFITQVKTLSKAHGIVLTSLLIIGAHYYLLPEKTKEIINDVKSVFVHKESEHIKHTLMLTSSLHQEIDSIRRSYDLDRVYIVALSNGVVNKDLRGTIKGSIKVESVKDETLSILPYIQGQIINPKYYSLLFYIIDEEKIMFTDGEMSGKNNPFKLINKDMYVVSLGEYNSQHYLLVAETVRKPMNPDVKEALDLRVLKFENALNELI